MHWYINRSDTDYVLMDVVFWPKILTQQCAPVSCCELDEWHCTRGRLMHMLVVIQLFKCFVGSGSDLFSPKRANFPGCSFQKWVHPTQLCKSLHLADHLGIPPIRSVDGYFIPDLGEKGLQMTSRSSWSGFQPSSAATIWHVMVLMSHGRGRHSSALSFTRFAGSLCVKQYTSHAPCRECDCLAFSFHVLLGKVIKMQIIVLSLILPKNHLVYT